MEDLTRVNEASASWTQHPVQTLDSSSSKGGRRGVALATRARTAADSASERAPTPTRQLPGRGGACGLLDVSLQQHRLTVAVDCHSQRRRPCYDRHAAEYLLFSAAIRAGRF
jgi:hypothetical protein